MQSAQKHCTTELSVVDGEISVSHLTTQPDTLSVPHAPQPCLHLPALRAPHPSTPLGACGPPVPGSARWAARGTSPSEVSFSEARRARRRAACGRREADVGPQGAAGCGPSAGRGCASSNANAAQLRTMPSEPTHAVRLHLAFGVAIVAAWAGIFTNRHVFSDFRSLRT